MNHQRIEKLASLGDLEAQLLWERYIERRGFKSPRRTEHQNNYCIQKGSRGDGGGNGFGDAECFGGWGDGNGYGDGDTHNYDYGDGDGDGVGSGRGYDSAMGHYYGQSRRLQ